MKKLKKCIVTLLACALCVFGTGSLVGCGSKENDPNTIYVKLYNGGFGTAWITKAGEEYTALTGTKVQVKTYKNEGMPPASLKAETAELFFLQDAHYTNYTGADVLADISDAVTKPNPYDNNKTVESKLEEDQKAWLKSGGSYYALPHYVGNWGLVYDKDVFAQNSYYFKEGKDCNDADTAPTDERELNALFTNASGNLGYGPDGEKGTDDDGLPATYTDFWILCDRIARTENTPVIWSGAQRGTYVTSLMTSLIADYLGKENLLKTLNFTAGVGINELANFSSDGRVLSFDGTAVFDGTNGYEIYRQKAYSEGLQFVKTLMETSKYGNGSGTSNNYVYTDAQSDFIEAKTTNKSIAMLVEGQWWENEAASVFNKLATNKGEEYAAVNRNFGWMPLPRANSEKVAQKSKATVLNSMDSLCVVRKSVDDEKLAKIIDFIQFLNSDAQLVKFTRETGAVRGVNYALSDADLDGLSSFRKSAIKYLQNANVVYTESLSKEYALNLYTVNSYDRYPYNAGSVSAVRPSLLFGSQNTVSAEKYFYTLYQNKKLTWLKAD